MQLHYFGWRRQNPDHRDLRFAASREVMASLPAAVDLSAGMGPVLDQGALGACGSNATDSLLMYDQVKQGLSVTTASRLFTYYNTRALQGDVKDDTGVDNRTLLKALNQSGFCDETVWPYDVSKYAVQPPGAAYNAAAPNRISSYAAVAQDAASMKGCLASGFPFLFGFTVYESFESDAVAASGAVPMPGRSEQVLGGHDVCIVGYDDATQHFKFKNSWGAGWGQSGYGTFPYAYCLDPNLASDFWAINAIPGGAPAPPTPPGPTPARLFGLAFSRPLPKGALISFRAPVAVPAGKYDVVSAPAAARGDVEALP